jgi:membrane protein implicated in regulation of membrane protease activity
MVRVLVRILGWLLTPLVAWAASFLGAWFGAAISGGFANPMTTFWVTAVCGAVAALTAAWGWLRYLRKHPKLQRTLAVAADGTPLIALEHHAPDITK